MDIFDIVVARKLSGGGGGSSTFVMTCTDKQSTAQGTDYIFDKTASEVLTALNNGQTVSAVVGDYPFEGNTMHLFMTSAVAGSFLGAVVLYSVAPITAEQVAIEGVNDSDYMVYHGA